MDTTYSFPSPQVLPETSNLSNSYPLQNEQPTLTPNSNTGVNPVTPRFGLGWLTCTFQTPVGISPSAYAHHLSSCYQHLTVDYFLKAGAGLNYYQNTLRYRSGSFMAFSEDRRDICLCVTQKALDTLSPKRLAKLLYRLNCFEGFKITRLDVYFDDYARVLNTFVVEQALQAGLHPSKSKVRNINRTWDGNTLLGDTIYIGSPHSEFYVRLYDKKLESDGKQDCIRLEFQLRSLTANTFFNSFLYTPFTNWGERCLGLLLSKFDFVERTGPRRDKTTRRLDWWHKFIASAASIPWRLPSLKPKLLATIAWAEDVLPTTLNMFLTVFGVDALATWAGRLARKGAARLKQRHKGMIDEYLASMRISATA